MTVIEFKSSRATLAQRKAVFVELRADLRRALELLTVCGSPLAPGESAAYRADAERHLVAVERQLAATCTETVAAVRTPSLIRELLLVVRMLARAQRRGPGVAARRDRAGQGRCVPMSAAQTAALADLDVRIQAEWDAHVDVNLEHGEWWRQVAARDERIADLYFQVLEHTRGLSLLRKVTIDAMDGRRASALNARAHVKKTPPAPSTEDGGPRG